MDRLIARAERLPDSSLIFGGWGLDRELAAQTVELLQGVVAGVATLGGVKREKVRALFRPIPRPASLRGPKPTPVSKIRALARTLSGRDT